MDKYSDMPDRITQTFKNKRILLTGGSGFMGKVFLEKMLRVCPDIDTFYLLMRPKKGKLPHQRLKDIFNNPLYDKLKEMYGLDYLYKKCKTISGDVSDIGLGLSKEDRVFLAENIHYIYHCAATIRFDEPLKHAVLLNTRGTKLMLEFAKECKVLELFCHMSTAYCQLKQKVLEERAYAPPANPHNVIKSIEWMDSEIVETITEKILGDLPNTYAFTKALGESLAVEQFDHLPVIILRPSIVIPIWKEPLPGWTDNINGPTGLLIGAGKGVLRSMYCNDTGHADFIPVDIAANAMAVCSWDYLTTKERRIYNLTSSHEIQVSWSEIIEIGRNIIETKMPLNGVVWYPGGSLTKSKTLHNLSVFFFHLIPAFIVDMLLFCLGYKPVLCRVQRRITKGFEVFEYYTNNQWIFENKNALLITELMNKREMLTYKLDRIGLDLEDYFKDCVHAARIHILKEPDDTLPAARRHMKVMYVVDKVVKSVFAVCMLYMMYACFISPFITA